MVIQILIVSIVKGQSQPAISGSVVSEGKPVELATIKYRKIGVDSLSTAFTTQRGLFSLPCEINQKYKIEILYIGLQKYTSDTILVRDGAGVNLGVINLIGGATSLKQVSIVSKKPLVVKKIDRLVIDVENNPFSPGTNFIDLLSMSPGVRVDAKENIRVQGKKGVVIYINNRPSNLSGDQLTQFLSTLPSDNIKNFEIITTPPSSYNAAGTSAILNINLRRPLSDGIAHRFSGSMTKGDNFENNLGYNIDVKKKQAFILLEYKFFKS